MPPMPLPDWRGESDREEERERQKNIMKERKTKREKANLERDRYRERVCVCLRCELGCPPTGVIVGTLGQSQKTEKKGSLNLSALS